MKRSLEGIAFREICQLFGKSRQAWYDIAQRQTNNRLQEELILQWVEEIRTILPRAGGVKLYKMLRDRFVEHNIKMGRDGLFELLRTHRLLIYPQKKFARTTQSWHHFKKWPNLLQDCTISRPDHVWVSDITFLRTESGFIYLSVITVY